MPDLDQNCLTLMVESIPGKSLKRLFWDKNLTSLKQEKHAKLPSMQKLTLKPNKKD